MHLMPLCGHSRLPTLFLIAIIITVFNVQLCYSDCAVNEFLCRNGDCILVEQKCNDHVDCADGSDEGDICNCVDTENTFKCASESLCLFDIQRCDGYMDCPGGEDEMNCGELPPSMTCTDNEFLCENGSFCIPLEKRCDGESLCIDGSDERNCTEIVKATTNGGQLNFLCNLETDHFSCSDSSACLPLTLVCDENIDCDDGSDESPLCKDLSCLNLRCPSDKCIQLPRGPECHCGEGFIVKRDTFTCEDINECATPGMCSQRCRNLPGSFECSCADHFHLSTDNTTCLRDSNEPTWIYYSSEDGIYKYNAETAHEISVVKDVHDVLAISGNSSALFWTRVNDRIFQMTLNQFPDSSDEYLTRLGYAGYAEGLAWDWWTDNLYYTDRTFNQIAVCGQFVKSCSVLITKGLDRPRGIALHPASGRMFWTDWGRAPFIGVAFMDGTDQATFLREDVYLPNGITVDQPSERLYWSDGARGLESISLNGEGRRLLRSSGEGSPFNVQVVGSRLYWTEKDQHTLSSMDKWSGKDVRVLFKKSQLRSLFAYDAAVYQRVNASMNPCHLHNCAHLCLLGKEGGFSCS